MARTKSDDLFRLIHSLTPEEKSYFKKFARRHGAEDNNLLKLFDAINAQKEFEEDGYYKKYKTYPMMKMRLFESILNSMIVYKKELPVPARIMKELIFGYILEDKGVLDKAQQYTEKTLKSAREEEQFLLEALAVHRNFNLSLYSWEPREMKKEMFDYLSDLDRGLEKERNKNVFQREHIKAYLSYLANIHHDPSIAYTEEPLNLELLRDKKNALTPGNNRRRLMSLIVHYQVKENFEEGYQAAVELFELEKKLIKDQPNLDHVSNYTIALRTLISLCRETGRIQEIEPLLNKAWKIPRTNEKEKIENFLFWVYKKTQLYWDMGRHSEGEKFVSQHIAAVMDKKTYTRYRAYILDILRYKILFQFSNGNYQAAMFSINDFESMDLKKFSPKYYKDCELLKILIQTEAAHFEPMRKFIRNILRKGKKLKLSDLERRILHLLKKANENNRRKTYRQILVCLFKGQEEITILSTFILKDWLISKINSKSFTEIIKRRYYTNSKK